MSLGGGGMGLAAASLYVFIVCFTVQVNSIEPIFRHVIDFQYSKWLRKYLNLFL